MKINEKFEKNTKRKYENPMIEVYLFSANESLMLSGPGNGGDSDPSDDNPGGGW